MAFLFFPSSFLPHSLQRTESRRSSAWTSRSPSPCACSHRLGIRSAAEVLRQRRQVSRSKTLAHTVINWGFGRRRRQVSRSKTLAHAIIDCGFGHRRRCCGGSGGEALDQATVANRAVSNVAPLVVRGGIQSRRHDGGSLDLLWGLGKYGKKRRKR
ncbi:unnamed protein product [Linum trigynum]|uniref:Uncharacterized protein n=1 Tax=Linum trigynum TaxID=586398 RepID=A0AAV2GMK2_9ROSI